MREPCGVGTHQGLWRDLHCLTSGLHHLGRLTVYLPEMTSMHSHAAHAAATTALAAAPSSSPDAPPPLQPVVICDGQQRLTTCLLLLAALRDAAEELCPPSPSSSTSTSSAELNPHSNPNPEPLARAAALRHQLVARVHKALFNHPASARLWHRQLVSPVPCLYPLSSEWYGGASDARHVLPCGVVDSWSNTPHW